MSFGTYKCEMCKRTFERTRPVEIAKKEGSEMFLHADDLMEICEDCYQLVSPENNPELHRRYLEALGKRN